MSKLFNIPDYGQIEVDDSYTQKDALNAIFLAKQDALVGSGSSPNSLQSAMETINRMERGLIPPPILRPNPDIETGPDRTYLGEILAGMRSGAQYTLGAGISGIERIAERVGLDPTGDEEGWLRQAGTAMKEGTESIKASSDKEMLFKFSNAFGSILGFAAPAVITAPLGGMASLVVASSLAGGTGADEAYERALEAGATEEQLTQSTLLGTGIGFSEVFAPIKLLRRSRQIFGKDRNALTEVAEQRIRDIGTAPATRGDLFTNLNISQKPFQDFGKRVATVAGLEGSQEATAAIAQNAVEKYIYNPDKALLNVDAIEEGLYGGSAGGLLTGILESFSLRKSVGRRRRMREAMETSTFKEIENNAINAVEEYETAVIDQTNSGLPEVFVQQAEQKVRHANELMTAYLQEAVYKSPEVMEYMANVKDDEGNLIYSREYLEALSGSNVEELYKRHVLLPSTKWEKDARDYLATQINPHTGSLYTQLEIDQIYKSRGRVTMRAEAKNLLEDENNPAISTEERNIRTGLRNIYGVPKRIINRLHNIFQDKLAYNEFMAGTTTEFEDSAAMPYRAFATLWSLSTKGQRRDIENRLFAPSKTMPGKDVTTQEFDQRLRDEIAKRVPKKPALDDLPDTTTPVAPPAGPLPTGLSPDAAYVNTLENKAAQNTLENLGISPDTLLELEEDGAIKRSAENNTFTVADVLQAHQFIQAGAAPSGTRPASPDTTTPIPADPAITTPVAPVAPVAPATPALPEVETATEVETSETLDEQRRATNKRIADQDAYHLLTLFETDSDQASDMIGEGFTKFVEMVKDFTSTYKGKSPTMGFVRSQPELFPAWHTRMMRWTTGQIGRKNNKDYSDRMQEFIGQWAASQKDPSIDLSEFRPVLNQQVRVVEQMETQTVDAVTGDIEGNFTQKDIKLLKDWLMRVVGPKRTSKLDEEKNIDLLLGDLETINKGLLLIHAGPLKPSALGVTVSPEDMIPGGEIWAIGVRTDKLDASLQGMTAFQNILTTTAHEAFHAAKRLVLTPEQQAILDRNITLEVADKNGLSGFIDMYRKQGVSNERLLEEAQAEIFGRWVGGEPIIGLQNPAVFNQTVSLYQKLKDFFTGFYNFLKGNGFIKPDRTTPPPVDSWQVQEADTIRKMYRDLADGTLAQQVGRLDADSASQLAAINIPQNYENLIGESLNIGGRGGGVSNTGSSGPLFGSWGAREMMDDLTGFARLFAHPSMIAQKNPLFKKFYNTVQKRVQLRNAFKSAAVLSADGLRDLDRAQLGTVGRMIALGDIVNAEPTFDMEKGTATITVSADIYNQQINKYNGEGNFRNQTGLSNADNKVNTRRVEDNIIFEVTGDAKVALALAQTRASINAASNFQLSGMIHQILTAPFYANIGITDIIKTVDASGNPLDYQQIADQLGSFLRLSTNPLLVKNKDGYVTLNKEKYRKAKADGTLEDIFPDIDPAFLKDESKLSVLIETLDHLHNYKIEGYFKRIRPNDRVVIATDPKTGKQLWMQSVDQSIFDSFAQLDNVGIPLVQKFNKSRQDKAAAELEAQVRTQFPGAKITNITLTQDQVSSEIQKHKNSAANPILDMINILEELMRKKPGSREIIDEVHQILSANRIKRLSAPREDIPGYFNQNNNDGKYFRQTFDRFVDTAANTGSSLFVDNDMLNDLKNLKDSGLKKFHQRAQEMRDYINNPQAENRNLRAFAFHSFLGFNLSSAVVNMTQTAQATYPILAGITGMGSSGVHVGRAYKDAIKLYSYMSAQGATRAGQYGFNFFSPVSKADGTTELVLNDKNRPKWMGKEEYAYLSTLFKDGVIQPIQNLDLGSGAVQELLPNKASQTFFNASGYAFGLVENMNRITAALAFRRAAMNTKNRKKFAAYARSTRFADETTDLDSLSPEAFADIMGRLGVEKTQFFMGTENRPYLLSGKTMSVVGQFQSFLWQMVGTYADVLTKSLGGRMGALSVEDQGLVRSMAMKQLAAMSLTMMAFGGVMGLPFMENFKELIRFFTEQFGDNVGEDIEQEMRNVLGEVMGYDLTDALVRGLPRSAGMDISRRTGYGDIIPFRLLMGGDPVDFAGPAISRFADMGKGIKTAIDNGNILDAVMAITPIAANNAYKALIKEPDVGTFTARGQQLLPAGTLSTGEMTAAAFGFTPGTISRAREKRGVENYLAYRSKKGKDIYSNRMAKELGAYFSAIQNGNFNAGIRHLNNYYKDYLHTSQHDIDNIMTPSRMYRINPDNIMKRVERSMFPFSGVGPRVPKDVRPEVIMGQMQGAIPTG